MQTFADFEGLEKKHYICSQILIITHKGIQLLEIGINNTYYFYFTKMKI